MVHGSPMPAAAAVKVCHGGDLFNRCFAVVSVREAEAPKKVCDAAS